MGLQLIADNTWEIDLPIIKEPPFFISHYKFPESVTTIYNFDQIPGYSLPLFSALLNLVARRFPNDSISVSCSCLAVRIALSSGEVFPIVLANYSLEGNVLRFTNNYNLTKPKKSPRFKFENHW